MKRVQYRQYWHFLDTGFKFQPYVSNGYHDMLIINGISKLEAKNLMQNIDLSEKSGTL